jgi:hypothetical protein
MKIKKEIFINISSKNKTCSFSLARTTGFIATFPNKTVFKLQ